MANLEQLRVLGKQVMAAAVDAEMLGLDAVSDYLGLAFDELAREAARLRELEARLEGERLLEKVGGVEGGS